jgi:hypothetical protein
MVNTVTAESHPAFEETSDEIIVEIWNDSNSPLIFAPTHGRLRARWVHANMAKTGRMPHKSIANLPDPILGMRIGINVAKRHCRVFDPLGTTPEGQKQWEATQRILKASPQLNAPCRVEKDQHFYTECSESFLKTWLYHLRMALDCKLIQVISGGPFPSLPEILAMRGKTEVGQLNQMAHKKQYLEDQPDWAPPESDGRELVGAGSRGGRGPKSPPVDPQKPQENS